MQNLSPLAAFSSAFIAENNDFFLPQLYSTIFAGKILPFHDGMITSMKFVHWLFNLFNFLFWCSLMAVKERSSFPVVNLKCNVEN